MANLLYNGYKTGCYVGWNSDSLTPGNYCYGYGNNIASYYADLQPNTTYTIKRYDTSSRMRLGLSSQDLKMLRATSESQVSLPFSQGFKVDSDDSFTFTTGTGDTHLVVYYTNTSEYTTRIMLNEGDTIYPYEAPTMPLVDTEWTGVANQFPSNSTEAAEGFVLPVPDIMWRCEEGYNNGFPFNKLLPNVPYIPPPEPDIPECVNWLSHWFIRKEDMDLNKESVMGYIFQKSDRSF